MRAFTLKALAVAACFAAVAFTACGDDDDSGTPQVVATTGILADITEQVVGENAQVEQLVPDSADPHSFSLSAEDRQTLEEAELVVANGAGLETGIPVDEAETSWTLTEHTGELLPFAGEDADGDDPHVWMDPTKVASALPSLAAALGQADAAHADAYAERAAQYAKRLGALDRDMQRTLQRVPEPNRELVTSHDSLEY
jgi:zinc/manganese transport system substrate-binding protein